MFAEQGVFPELDTSMAPRCYCRCRYSRKKRIPITALCLGNLWQDAADFDSSAMLGRLLLLLVECLDCGLRHLYLRDGALSMEEFLF